MPKDKSNNNFLIGAGALLIGLYLYKKSQTAITPTSARASEGLQPGISTGTPALQNTPGMITPSDVLSDSAFAPVPRLIPTPSQSLSSSVDPLNQASIYSSTGIYF